MEEVMYILVTNDDGVWAPGVQALAKKMTEVGEVVLVAPLEEKSAIGHGITIRDPIRVEEIKLDGLKKVYGVNGTPADCVKLGIEELMEHECGLVISGINQGPNLGTDVLYSGTVSAAIEGVLLRTPSIAVSLASWEHRDFSVAAEITAALVRKMIRENKVLPPGTLLNINIPAVEKEKIKGIRITELGPREYENHFEKRYDPRGNAYFWAVGKLLPTQGDHEDCDTHAVENNYVSITPLQFDLTNYEIIQEIRKWGLEDSI
jgi:5'-nucleotidase